MPTRYLITGALTMLMAASVAALAQEDPHAKHRAMLQQEAEPATEYTDIDLRDRTLLNQDGDEVRFASDYFDPAGVACDGLVHGVVEDFGDQMVQGAFVRSADIHTGSHANGFQPLQHFDRRSVIVARSRVFTEKTVVVLV